MVRTWVLEQSLLIRWTADQTSDSTAVGEPSTPVKDKWIENLSKQEFCQVPPPERLVRRATMNFDSRHLS